MCPVAMATRCGRRDKRSGQQRKNGSYFSSHDFHTDAVVSRNASATRKEEGKEVPNYSRELAAVEAAAVVAAQRRPAASILPRRTQR